MKGKWFYENSCSSTCIGQAFYEGRSNQGIYKYFRNEYRVYGNVFKPTGVMKGKEYISLKGIYNFSWKSAGENKKYFMIEV